MKKINTHFGAIYIETLENREEEDRIKVYDSLKRYCDYWSIETLISMQNGNKTLEKVYKELVQHYENAVKLDTIVPNILFKANNVYQMVLYLLTKDGIDKARIKPALCNKDEKTLETIVLEDDWINKIGKWYIYTA